MCQRVGGGATRKKFHKIWSKVDFEQPTYIPEEDALAPWRAHEFLCNPPVTNVDLELSNVANNLPLGFGRHALFWDSYRYLPGSGFLVSEVVAGWELILPAHRSIV